ncbi:MarR family winged helix-turn-helix transcriptional regulator [Streptomyces thermodiastaticus]|jgi:DNA-binding MarR family transcriptional regulator|uniref:MarR family winged helix-turn-helix transcriptional regulator n=1 Tax=Streptomyces thermodiastaticus TaxID=44061 RepID=UPI00167911B1|nr:MarR family transcriptional regulator [Streptomyces thermodiastaticus]MCE7551853.1 MarR family transcriptional regulator [Streptomyces thermodiastaticus]
MDTPDRSRSAEELMAVVSQLNRRMRAASPQGSLSPSQRIVLGRLHDGPATTAALARAEHVRPQSMRVTLAALEASGLVERSPHPTDGRQVVFSLTGAGRRRLTELRQAKETWLADAIAARLDADEQRVLAQAVELMKRLVQS